MEIAHNTIYRAGFDAIATGRLYSTNSENPARIHHNFIDAVGLFTKDAGGVKFVGHMSLKGDWTDTPSPNGTRVDHNLIRNVLSSLGNPLYFDFADGFVCDHNVVYNCSDFINVNDAGNIKIYNNTGVTEHGGIGGIIRGGDRFWNFRDVSIVNNISNHGIIGVEKRDDRLHPSFTVENNLTGIDPAEIFVDPAHGDFRLKDGSAAIDAGLVIRPYTDGYTGEAPDLGAIEKGAGDWVEEVGADRQIVAAPGDLTGKALPDGSVQLRWKDNADNETGYVIEVGYPNHYWTKGRYFNIIGRVGPDETTFTGKVPVPMEDNMFRVRADRSYYSNTIKLYAGISSAETDFEQGYAPGGVVRQRHWFALEGGRGMIKGVPKGEFGMEIFDTSWARIASEDGNHYLEIQGPARDKTNVVAVGNLHTLLPGFDAGESKLKLNLRVKPVGLDGDKQKAGVKITIGGLEYWQGPGGAIGQLVVAKDGTLKWGWREIGPLKADEWNNFEGVFNFQTGKFADLLLNGQPLKDSYDYKPEPGNSLSRGLWQINSDLGEQGQKVLLDDLGFTLMKE